MPNVSNASYHAAGAFIGAIKWKRDFKGVQTRTSFKHVFAVNQSNHTEPPLGATHPDHPNYYLVDSGDPKPIGGDVVHITREYAMIPAARTEYQSYGWEIPGLATETPPGSLINISSATVANQQHTLNLATAHGGTVGQTLRVSYTETTVNGSVSLQVVRPLLAGSSGTTAVIKQIQTKGTLAFQTAQIIDQGRDAESEEVHSEIRYDYWMIPQSVPTIADIPRIEVYPKAYNSDGKRTDTLSETTSPSKAEYLAKVAAEEYICAVASNVKRWKGPIYVRKTRFVRAE